MLNKKHYDVLCIGQALVDIFATGIPENLAFEGDRIEPDMIEIATGGDACNQASLLAAYGCDTALIGPIGSRELENQTFGGHFQNLEVQSLDSDSCITAKSIVLIHNDGQRKIITNLPKKPDTLRIDFGNAESIGFLSYASFFGIPWLDEISEDIFDRAKKLGATIFADTTGGGKNQNISLEPYYKYIDYFVPSYEEARVLSGEEDVEKITSYFLDMGCKNAIIKMGKKGFHIQNAGMNKGLPVFRDVEVKDTCGAGDTFVSSLIYGLNKSWSLTESLNFANAAASISVTQYGANGNIKSVQQVEDFISE